MSQKKSLQLGINFSTATSRLRKTIMFKLLCELKQNVCYQCNELIININDFTIEHKTPWLDSINPCELFFSLDNIGFSHAKCNLRARRKGPPSPHGSLLKYSRGGCRCELCTERNRLQRRKDRAKLKN